MPEADDLLVRSARNIKTGRSREVFDHTKCWGDFKSTNGFDRVY